MKKLIAVIAASVLLCSCGENIAPEIIQNSPAPQFVYPKEKSSEVADKQKEKVQKNVQEYTPLNYDEQKAVWISYIDLHKLLADTEREFYGNISQAFDKISQLGLNTVYVHVRAFGDAYYLTSDFALNKDVPVEGGTPLYDPLEIMTKLAHERGLSFHAWINPLRLCGESAMQDMPQESLIYKAWSDSESFSQYAVKPEEGDTYWFNPAYPEVRKFIAEGAKEVCERYDVDGVHIDDYFYPTTSESFDSAAFEKYRNTGGENDLAKWRIENCSLLVSEMYSAVKSVDEHILFGVSPQGNIDNNYSLMYADVRRWCSEEGFLDYICPQIYFGYYNTVCPFSETLISWEKLVTAPDTKLVCGLGLYQAEQDSEFINDTGIIARQIEDCAAREDCSGFAIFSYESLFDKDTERLNNERAAIAEMCGAE